MSPVSLAIWHEIVTWYTKIRYSSFSPEDNFSNLVGAWIGGSPGREARISI